MRAPECSPRRLAASPQAQGASALAQLSRFNRDNQDSVACAGGIKLLVELLAPHHPFISFTAANKADIVSAGTTARSCPSSSGTGFAGLVGLHTATRRFGADTFTPAYFQNATYVLCTTPPRRRGLMTHPVGRAAFVIALDGQDYHRTAAASANVANVTSNSGAATFTIYAAALDSIAPTYGGLHGGELVTVHGRGFDLLGGLGLDGGGGVPLDSPWRLSLILALAIIAAAEHAKAKRAKKDAKKELKKEAQPTARELMDLERARIEAVR